MPHLKHERLIGGLVAGVDEVGRGPLAGPVLAAAVILPARLPRGLAGSIDDSKKLSPGRRVRASSGGCGMPHLKHERLIGGLVAGVDEVGRGPLAGPVLAAAVILPARLPRGLAGSIDDSKKLSPGRRVEIHAALRACGAEIALGAASVREINGINIFHASMLAMRRAIARLPRAPHHVLVDGKAKPGGAIPCTTIIGGDAISLSIAAASIAAKVTRDLLMARLHLRYPQYCWHSNAGYAARSHRAAITEHGVTPHHRANFGETIRALARLSLDEVEPCLDPLQPELDPVDAA